MAAQRSAGVAQKGKTETTPGLFPGVIDKTQELPKLPTTQKLLEVKGIVLHRTESSDGQGTINTYRGRTNHYGAHYLIDEKGQIFLTVPTDKVVYHATRESPKYKKAHNDLMLGVEVVGKARKIDFAQGATHIRAEIDKLRLTPKFLQRLKAYKDKELKEAFRTSGGDIYEDITGVQKRAVWWLAQLLATKYTLTVSVVSTPRTRENGEYQTEGDFNAHEHISPKSLDEGEASTEFLQTHSDFLVRARKHIRDSAWKLPFKPWTPVRAPWETPAQSFESLIYALEVDGPEEKAALEEEKKQGLSTGPAQEREDLRIAFYDCYYKLVGTDLTQLESFRPSKGPYGSWNSCR